MWLKLLEIDRARSMRELGISPAVVIQQASAETFPLSRHIYTNNPASHNASNFFI
jgi:hypothetical protein